MSLAQSNFDHARRSGRPTLRTLASDAPLELQAVNQRALESMAWDLEAIQTAIRIELNNRFGGTQTTDYGI